MELSRFMPWSLALMCLAIVANLYSGLMAGEGHRACCPKCHQVCVLEVSEDSESKYCWKVESKTVCIPKVRFSWQWPWEKNACGPQCDGTQCDGKRCDALPCDNMHDIAGKCVGDCCNRSRVARTRKVCVLVKHEYECPSCKYSWVLKEPSQAACAAGEEVSSAIAPLNVADQTTTALPLGQSNPLSSGMSLPIPKPQVEYSLRDTAPIAEPSQSKTVMTLGDLPRD